MGLDSEEPARRGRLDEHQAPSNLLEQRDTQPLECAVQVERPQEHLHRHAVGIIIRHQRARFQEKIRIDWNRHQRGTIEQAKPGGAT